MMLSLLSSSGRVALSLRARLRFTFTPVPVNRPAFDGNQFCSRARRNTLRASASSSDLAQPLTVRSSSSTFVAIFAACVSRFAYFPSPRRSTLREIENTGPESGTLYLPQERKLGQQYTGPNMVSSFVGSVPIGVIAILFGSALLRMFAARFLPEHH